MVKISHYFERFFMEHVEWQGRYFPDKWCQVKKQSYGGKHTWHSFPRLGFRNIQIRKYSSQCVSCVGGGLVGKLNVGRRN